MGNCGMSPEEREQMRKSEAIEKEMADAYFEEMEKIKLLLLGAGESGKSTVFKQMKVLYGVGFQEEDRRGFVPMIYNNVITSMKTLVENMHLLGFEVEDSEALSEFEDVTEEMEINDKLADVLDRLWNDIGIQKTFEERSKFQLPDSSDYFFNKVKEISAECDYLPNVKDVLRVRIRTSGIVEEVYTINNVTFVMFDVGGQRNERKKWIHCFDGVQAIIFVAAISEYDQALFEDRETNRMTEALNLFAEIANSRWFTDTSIILFLNKKDLFEEKIKKVDPVTWFPDYKGGCDYEAGVEFFKGRFVEKNENEDKEVYTHVVCATDTENVGRVFDACKDIITKGSLRDGGYM